MKIKKTLSNGDVPNEQGKLPRKQMSPPKRLAEELKERPAKDKHLNFDEMTPHTPKKKRPKTGLVE